MIILIIFLIALIVYVTVGMIFAIKQINRMNNEDEKEIPDHGSYDDLIKYRRGRSKH